jgi:hypothetical protein
MSVDRMTNNLAWLNNSLIYERPSVDHCLRLKARYTTKFHETKRNQRR